MRKLCWVAYPFCAATLAACLGLPWLLPLSAAAAAAGAGCALGRRWRACLACAGIAFGLLWSLGYQRCVLAPAAALEGTEAEFSATVLDWPRETTYGGASMTVRLHLPGAPDSKMVLYTTADGLSLRAGDRISGLARFQSASTVRGEEVSYYEAKGVHLRANASGVLTVRRPGLPPVTVWPAYASRALKRSAGAIFPADTAALATALLTGDKSGLPDSVYAALRRSGAAHIVAVSGLHLSFFAQLLYVLFPRRSRAGAALTILLVFLFALVAGSTPSVTRAAFMVSMTRLAPLLGREEDRPTTLAAILLVLLLVDPYAVRSVSLQLSFGAVAGISLVSTPLYRSLTRPLARSGGSLPRKLGRKAWRFCAANLSTTLGALLLTTPLTAYHFGTISLIAPVTDLLTLWAVSLAFAPSLVLTIAGIALPNILTPLAFPFVLLLRYVQAMTGALAELPFASVSTDGPYLSTWLVLVYLLLLSVLLKWWQQPLLPVCAGAVTLGIALALTRASVLSYPLSVTMLDVGQGQCILLCSGGRTALVDCGGSEGNAGDTAADYLQSLGISRLDLLILTHCHSDHANGVPELLTRLEVSELILPDLDEDGPSYRPEILEQARRRGTEVALLSDDKVLALGETLLTLYAPLGDGGTNEEGLFVLASRRDFDLLVTGDAAADVEALLVEHAALPDIEVLVAGHHGSQSSTSDVLLDAVTPEICLISVGYNNYGHPTEEVLARLTQRGIDIYRTDRMGDLALRIEGD